MGFFNRIKISSKALDVTVGLRKILEHDWGMFVDDMCRIPPDAIFDKLLKMANTRKHGFHRYLGQIEKISSKDYESEYENIQMALFYVTLSYVETECKAPVNTEGQKEIYDVVMKFMKEIDPNLKYPYSNI